MNRPQTVETLRTLKFPAMADVYEASARLGPNNAPTAGAVVHEACLRGTSTRYVRATKLFPTLRLARADGSYFDEIKRFAKTGLLIGHPMLADARLQTLPRWQVYVVMGGRNQRNIHEGLGVIFAHGAISDLQK